MFTATVDRAGMPDLRRGNVEEGSSGVLARARSANDNVFEKRIGPASKKQRVLRTALPSCVHYNEHNNLSSSVLRRETGSVVVHEAPAKCTFSKIKRPSLVHNKRVLRATSSPSVHYNKHNINVSDICFGDYRPLGETGVIP